ncbi:MAG: hypothetical protein ACHQZQ_06185 [SAR324 cluster bacterium]
MSEEMMPIAYAASLAISVVMALAAWKRPILGRVLLVLLFAWAGPTNLHAILTQPDLYLGYAQYAYVDLYRHFILGPFSRHIPIIVGAIAICQLITAFLLLTSGRALRGGLLGAIVFLLAIAPLGTGAGFPATVLMALAAGLILWHDRHHPQPFLGTAILQALRRGR